MISDALPTLPAWAGILAAIVAPLLVWLLWRLQVLSVEFLRSRLVKLIRHQGWLYNTVSWFGVFLHEISHASVLILSGHGIKQFRVGTDSGHVLPRRTRNGPVGFLFFLVAALAPLFGPPLLALAGLIWLVDRGLVPWATAGPGLAPALNLFESLLISFPVQLLAAIGRLDLSNPWHAAALLVILLGIPGSRPSHVKGSRFHGKDDEGDIAVVRKRIRKNPWPVLGFLAILIVAYFPLTKWLPAAYWYPFEAVWAVAITAIVLAIFGAVWWTIVAFNGAVKPWLGWLGPATLIGAQIGLRQFGEFSVSAINGISMILWIAVVAALYVLAGRRKGPSRRKMKRAARR